MLGRLRRKLSGRPLPPAAGYDLWAATYDDQPRNLMLALESEAFTALLAGVDLRGRTVVDVGCGTGRHWPELLAAGPSELSGYDVSEAMLARLRAKHPGARAWVCADERLAETPPGAAGAIVSTLALAHVADLGRALAEWNRALAPGGEVLITDYHPAAFEKGADRTFRHRDRTVAIVNHVHPLDALRRRFDALGWRSVRLIQRELTSDLREAYQAQGALRVYERFFGTPLLYAWHLRKA